MAPAQGYIPANLAAQAKAFRVSQSFGNRNIFLYGIIGIVILFVVYYIYTNWDNLSLCGSSGGATGISSWTTTIVMVVYMAAGLGALYYIVNV